MDNTATKVSTLIGAELVMGQLAMSHLTDGVNEVSAVEIFEPVLIQIVSVGPTMEVGG